MDQGRDWVKAFIGLGANVGEPLAQLQSACKALQTFPKIKGFKSSRFYVSAPWQATGPDFVNAVVEITTLLTAPELLSLMQEIERAAGRQRPYRHAPRTLDLDLIFFGHSTISSPSLVVPHPRWSERAFVLKPLADLAPELVENLDWKKLEGQGISVLEQPTEVQAPFICT
ncbi:MAG: 2-amino-4-hydroxy-6-hydroxymethyldihydropteridine diphosphokinase [Betaproteobacteria bacterium]|nr:2-amino-4-hydroxy-6-hydroxymethyldihydropteridine diphosphokinase [Betaproteobacteria bacterium]NBY06207.1 2-amino-4-hydroxy-6-hydroxymethyldihydropteridine diphosphokinase [Betaproteobacteria bacterium]